MAVGTLPVEAVAFVHNGVAQGAIGFTAATALQIGRAGVITLVVAAVTLHAITFHKTERPRCHQTVRWFVFRTQCWCIPFRQRCKVDGTLTRYRHFRVE